MTQNFIESADIGSVAETYALNAVEIGRDSFMVLLDWSDASIAHVESMLDRLHNEIVQAQPSEETVMGFAKIFGSYVGEVFRRNHGATWGLVQLAGDMFPSLRASNSAEVFWPWKRVRNRIAVGPQESVSTYYQVLLERNGCGPAAMLEEVAGTKRSWWRSLSGH